MFQVNQLIIFEVCVNLLQAGLPTMDDCALQAENCETVFDRVKYYMLSSTPEIGLDIGLAAVKGLICL